jgi:hypothetical protein
VKGHVRKSQRKYDFRQQLRGGGLAEWRSFETTELEHFLTS